MRKADCEKFNTADERKSRFVEMLIDAFIADAKSYLRLCLDDPIQQSPMSQMSIYVPDQKEFFNYLNPTDDSKRLLTEKDTTDEIVIRMCTIKAMADAVEAYERITEDKFWYNEATDDIYTFVDL
jgi:hypothetical protein